MCPVTLSNRYRLIRLKEPIAIKYKKITFPISLSKKHRFIKETSLSFKLGKLTEIKLKVKKNHKSFVILNYKCSIISYKDYSRLELCTIQI